MKKAVLKTSIKRTTAAPTKAAKTIKFTTKAKTPPARQKAVVANPRDTSALAKLSQEFSEISALVEQLQSSPGEVTQQDAAMIDQIAIRGKKFAANLAAFKPIAQVAP